jgi:hypothetical protein
MEKLRSKFGREHVGIKRKEIRHGKIALAARFEPLTKMADYCSLGQWL